MSTLTRAQACSILAATAAACCLPAAAAVPLPSEFIDAPRVELGADRFVRSVWQSLRGKRLGLVTNHTGLTSDGKSLIDVLHANPNVDLRALYGPEHGLRGTTTAGASVGSGKDAATGLPIYSLYGKTKRPSANMLADVDVMLFDIQDVGARTYTYISTLAMVMQAAAASGKAVWVLDRPNPIGGKLIEGPVLDPAFASFIGLYPLPMRHGMTIGEIAQLYRRHFGIDCQLEIVTMRNYRRDMLWNDTGLRWVPTSPNIPRFATALVYLTTGPIGTAGLNNGIGSGSPFELALAPGLDGYALAAALNARKLEGAFFKPVSWIPANGYYAGKRLSGVQIQVTQAHHYHSVLAGVEILSALRRLHPEVLRYNHALDKDWGTDTLRTMLAHGVAPEAMFKFWRPRLDVFLAKRDDSLIYT